MRRFAPLLSITLLASACTPLYNPVASVPPREAGCRYEVLASTPETPFWELGVETFRQTHEFSDEADFRRTIGDDVCRRGGDAVVPVLDVGGATRGFDILLRNAQPPVHVSFAGAPPAPHPRDCAMELLTIPPSRPFEEIGVVEIREGVRGWHGARTLEDFRSLVAPYVCLSGGDAAVAISGGHDAVVGRIRLPVRGSRFASRPDGKVFLPAADDVYDRATIVRFLGAPTAPATPAVPVTP